MNEPTRDAGPLTIRGLLAGGVAAAALPGSARASAVAMNLWFSFADPASFRLPSNLIIQRRCDLYKQVVCII